MNIFSKSSSTPKRKLLYADSGRDGYVIYKDALGEIPMYFEFGGGECVAIIQLPTAAEWTKKFRRIPEEREDVIHFTAQQAIRDKAPGCNYRIAGNAIEFFK